MADHLGFLLSQVSHIDHTAYEIKYPDIQYQNLVPIDTSASEWAANIVHFSSDKTGQAEIFLREIKHHPAGGYYQNISYPQG